MGKRYLEGLKKGFAGCEARDIWAAKIAIDRRLGNYRIGRTVMYMPDADVNVNRQLHVEIQGIRSL